MIEIQQTLKLHNKFELRVEDAVTGEVKQNVTAYNVITDNMIKGRTTGLWSSVSRNLFDRIVVGDGSGTPSTSDTALFNQILEKTSEVVEDVFQYPTSHITRQIKIEATECNGKTITEVGFFTTLTLMQSS